MILIAYKNEIRLTGKHVDNVSDYWLAINFNQGLRSCVARTAKTLSKAGHGNNNLHKTASDNL